MLSFNKSPEGCTSFWSWTDPLEIWLRADKQTSWLRADESGRIGEWRVRSASHATWPAVALSVQGNIVPDFPLINKSFSLCYACTDK